MTVLAINHINLRAPRPMMEKLRAFYVDVVGLQEGARPSFQSFGYWLYAAGHPVVHLSESAPASGGTELERPGDAASTKSGHASIDHTTYDHVAFTCSDRAATEARLRQHNITYRVAQVPMTGQVQVFLRDPAGNGVELNFAGQEA
jgi:catechol 2,3-dioxygenase-like lactoylglutathione lyase family enzyme